jgi:hypothetical protein
MYNSVWSIWDGVQDLERKTTLRKTTVLFMKENSKEYKSQEKAVKYLPTFLHL